MATFAITAAVNFDSADFVTRIGNDTYNINGGSLTIDTDTRYCGNSDATKGTLGNMVISASLGGSITIDGTKVRLIPFDSGSGNAPAIGTTITQGGVTSSLLGVWPALNVPPTAVGAAMPAAGYIKVKNKAGGDYAAGALAGIAASATGADVVGWIEIVGVETKYAGVPRLGTFIAQGAWFDLGNTSGTANQTVQLPASLNNTYYPGIYVEDAVGSGNYEFWPNILPIVRATTPTDKRGKVCWISAAGLLRIGNNGTNTVGFVPISGCKMRVPNIVTINAAAASLSVNAVPNATVLNRYTFATSGQGALVFDKCNLAWYPGFTTPWSVSMTDTAWLDALYLNQPRSSGVTLTRCGNGVSSAVATNIAMRLSKAASGATMTDCAFFGRDGGSTGILIELSNSVTVTRTKGFLLQPRANGGYGGWLIGGAKLAFNDCVFGSGRLNLVVSDSTFNNSHYVDSFEGLSDTANPTSAVQMASGSCKNVTFDGFDYWGLNNVHPRYYPFNITQCANIKIRNIGSLASPLDLGTVNPSDIFISYAGTVDLTLQRVYTKNCAYRLYYGDTSASGTIIENCTTDYSDTNINEVGQNVMIKGLGSLTSIYATGTPGYCFSDCFVSATAGYLIWFMNEQTADIRSAGSYVTTGNAKFTGSGGLVMPTVGDSIEWTTPYYVLGHTGFANTAPVFSGPTAGNFTRTYSLDKNDGNGFGAYKTCTTANLFAEAGIDASKGFKMKLKIVTDVANTNTLSVVYMTTVSSAVAQAYQYPLDTAQVSVNGLVTGSRVKAVRVDNGAILFNGLESGGTVSFSTDYIGLIEVEARKASSAPYYRPWASRLTTVSGSTVSATAIQILD